MTKAPLFAAASAALLLASCGKPKPQVIDTNPDPMANVLANAPKVTLPPAIKASVTMRCTEDNSLIYADFFQGDQAARVRTTKDGAPIELKSDKAGGPWTDAAGNELKGDDKKVTWKSGGKSKTCHV